MSDWTHRAVIAVPVSERTLANSIARAFDPDTGGGASFDAVYCGDPATHVVCDTPLTTATAGLFHTLQSDAGALYGMCQADYASRWPELPPPTLADCQRFLAHATMTVEPAGRPLVDVLADMTLQAPITKAAPA